MPEMKKEKKNGSPTPQPWCANFDATLGEQISFPTAPANATIGQSGNVFPFCGANDVNLIPPVNVNGPSAVAIYICSGLTVGQPYPFVPNPPCGNEMTKSVTISG
jgi:hypothetical protein